MKQLSPLRPISWLAAIVAILAAFSSGCGDNHATDEAFQRIDAVKQALHLDTVGTIVKSENSGEVAMSGDSPGSRTIITGDSSPADLASTLDERLGGLGFGRQPPAPCRPAVPCRYVKEGTSTEVVVMFESSGGTLQSRGLAYRVPSSKSGAMVAING